MRTLAAAAWMCACLGAFVVMWPQTRDVEVLFWGLIEIARIGLWVLAFFAISELLLEQRGDRSSK